MSPIIGAAAAAGLAAVYEKRADAPPPPAGVIRRGFITVEQSAMNRRWMKR
jgi:hypothetical protein